MNGLLLGVIECKSPYVTNLMEEGINQLKHEVSSVFFVYLKENHGLKIGKRNLFLLFVFFSHTFTSSSSGKSMLI